MDVDSFSLWIRALLVGGLVIAGCEGRGTSPGVPAGTYRARVHGAFTDTLSGAVHYRMRDGALTGLELGAEDGVGLSIELEPRSPGLRTYEVIEAELFGLERTDAPPGAMAFLTLDRAQFEAIDGTFNLTYVSADRVGATFTFQMEGTADSASAEPVSVEVEGALNASSER